MLGRRQAYRSSFPDRPHAALAACALAAALLLAPPAAAAPIHTTYLWHMHQPIYWPEQSTWTPSRYGFAHETIALGHGQSDVFSIFDSDDRVRDYQDYPKLAIQSVLAHPDAGAQVSFAGSLIQNVQSLAAAGWNGGRYAPSWWQPYRDAIGWTTSGGRPRLDPVIVAFHHPIGPLVDDAVFRRMLQTQKAIMPSAWGAGPLSKGFFPAEMCFSERLIPALVDEGLEWSIVGDTHFARACADYPWEAGQDQCDPPNRADQVNPPQGAYHAQSISRGVTTKVPAPFGFRPHRAHHVDPATGAVSEIVVVPAANAMGWNEGYGLYGTGEIDSVAHLNDPARPMLILFAHDGDNAWSGGNSYYEQNVAQFTNAAAQQGYEPTTIAEYLADHPVAPDDVVHVEDGGWVNADGDFGSPQFINWNWPLVNASGQFDVPNGWAEDERNWAVLTAAVNRVLTAEQIAGPPDPTRIVDPALPGATALEKAWHFLLAGHESGYMYYGAALDFEIKPTLAANRAVGHADPIVAGGVDLTPPTIWLPQRLPWNPGGRGGGSLWGYPGGDGAAMTRDFHVWTFVHDVSGVAGASLVYRIDGDGVNPLASIQNETWAGGPEVGAWQSLTMTRRVFPKGDVFDRPDIDFTVLPQYIADQFWVKVEGFENVLIDYFVEAVDSLGHVRRSPIQHVWVDDGDVDGGGGGPAVRWSPASPQAGGSLTIEYDPVPGALPDAASPVYVHIGHSGWTNVLSPDPVMSWNVDSARWVCTYSIPSTATSVDFVFRDGAGNWDNHGGADWHVPVSGSQTPPHLIDGSLDPGLAPLASCGGADLYADFDGRWLYVAAPAAGTTPGLDHFVLVARPETGGVRSAPWAKSGQAAQWDLLMGQEDDSGWSGWFDGAEVLTTAGITAAAGAVLEARIDTEARWGAAPASLRLAFAAYATPNGGALAQQAPCGNGDGHLDAPEWVEVFAPTLGLPPAASTARTTVRWLSGNPSRGGLRAAVDAAATPRLTATLIDVAGREVATLHDGPAAGAVEVRLAEGAWHPAPGLYFLVVDDGRARVAARVAVIR